MAEQVTAGRRAFALLALAALVAAILAGLLALNHGGVWRLIVIAVVMAVTVVGLWYLVATRGTTRLSGGLAAGAGVIAFVLVALTAPHKGLLVLLALALAAVSAIAARRALRPPTTIGQTAAATDRVAPAGHPVLIMNPWSGGGKVEKFDLVEECRRRGIEPVVLSRGDDLLELAQRAIDSGADVIGMAGGDGSQALVASLASRHGIPARVHPRGHPQPLRARPRARPRRRRRCARRVTARRSSGVSTWRRSTAACSSTTPRWVSTRRSCSRPSTATPS